MTEDDKKKIMNEIKIWYGSNYDTFLDSVISKYHGESTVIKQLCVPIKGELWSIIDIKVYFDETIETTNNLGSNGYVKEIIFKDTQAPTMFDNFDAITNKSLFSKVWWKKYFGLYSC